MWTAGFFECCPSSDPRPDPRDDQSAAARSLSATIARFALLCTPADRKIRSGRGHEAQRGWISRIFRGSGATTAVAAGFVIQSAAATTKFASVPLRHASARAFWSLMRPLRMEERPSLAGLRTGKEPRWFLPVIFLA